MQDSSSYGGEHAPRHPYSIDLYQVSSQQGKCHSSQQNSRISDDELPVQNDSLLVQPERQFHAPNTSNERWDHAVDKPELATEPDDADNLREIPQKELPHMVEWCSYFSLLVELKIHTLSSYITPIAIKGCNRFEFRLFFSASYIKNIQCYDR